MTGTGWTGMRMGPMLDVPRDQFEELVGEALDRSRRSWAG